MKYRESEEMYMETILLLKQKNATVYSIDIATELNYSRPSVSRAVNLLQKKGYITIDKSGAIAFTKAGEDRATEIYNRHKVITQMLIKMGASDDLAEDNACRIEHVVSDELVKIISEWLKK